MSNNAQFSYLQQETTFTVLIISDVFLFRIHFVAFSRCVTSGHLHTKGWLGQVYLQGFVNYGFLMVLDYVECGCVLHMRCALGYIHTLIVIIRYVACLAIVGTMMLLVDGMFDSEYDSCCAIEFYPGIGKWQVWFDLPIDIERC